MATESHIEKYDRRCAALVLHQMGQHAAAFTVWTPADESEWRGDHLLVVTLDESKHVTAEWKS